MEAIPLDGEMGKNKDAADNPPMDVMTPPSPGPHSDLTNGAKKEPINLDEFDRRQKLIEEQNRLKKELLGKALALRYLASIQNLNARSLNGLSFPFFFQGK